MYNCICITLICIILLQIITASITNQIVDHQYSLRVSKQISEGIKTKLLDNLYKIANLTAKDYLRTDLETGSHNMKILDAVTANQIFGIFQLNDPDCDNNKNGYIEQKQLKCLNKIWKYYVLPDQIDLKQS